MPAQNEETTMPAILAAIWSIMKTVTSVEKGRQYAEGQTRYKFRSIDDLLRDVGAACRDFGVFLQSEQLDYSQDRDRVTKHGQPWTTVIVTKRFKFTSLVDGSFLTFEASGEGADISDKATMKANTMALKAALGQAFMLPTDEKDPDAERPEDFGPPIGGQQFDPNEGARQRHAAERQRAASAGVEAPSADGSPEERRERHVQWVRAQLRSDALTLERLAFIHLITGQRGMLGFDTGGVPLGKRIAAELAKFGMDPNGAMPTPEQALNRMQAGA